MLGSIVATRLLDLASSGGVSFLQLGDNLLQFVDEARLELVHATRYSCLVDGDKAVAGWHQAAADPAFRALSARDRTWVDTYAMAAFLAAQLSLPSPAFTHKCPCCGWSRVCTTAFDEMQLSNVSVILSVSCQTAAATLKDDNDFTGGGVDGNVSQARYTANRGGQVGGPPIAT